jgi:hypothetical protein
MASQTPTRPIRINIMPVDPRTGRPLPYPGQQGPGMGPGMGGGGGGQPFNPGQGIGGPPPVPPQMAGGIQRPPIGGPPTGGGPMGGGVRRRGGPPPMGGPPMGGGRPTGGRVAPPQMAMNKPAESGPPIGDFALAGAAGAMPGVGPPGAVNPNSVMNLPASRKRQRFA